jgi:hypothetical protein
MIKKALFMALALVTFYPALAQDVEEQVTQPVQPQEQQVVVPQELQDQQQERRYQMYGVMFYNLENLFDTINNNGVYDKEFSPEGARQWNGTKYWQKQHNMAYTIGQMEVNGSPAVGPVIIGVSEIENITVLQDLVRQPEIKDRRYQIVHHDSPDRRGVDVGLLYNPRFFKVLNVTNQRINKYLPDYPEFRSRDQLCVTGMLAGEKVSVIVNHWPSRLGGEEQSSYLREAAGRMARETMDSLLRDDPNQGIIFMGDLNDDPQNKSCSEAVGAKKEIKDCLAEPGSCFNPWWNILNRGIGTLGYKGNWNLFDQIIITDYFLKNFESKEKPTLTFLRAEVLNRKFLRSNEGDRQGYPLRTFSGGVFLNGYSDHFPTMIYLVKEVK